MNESNENREIIASIQRMNDLGFDIRHRHACGNEMKVLKDELGSIKRIYCERCVKDHNGN